MLSNTRRINDKPTRKANPVKYHLATIALVILQWEHEVKDRGLRKKQELNMTTPRETNVPIIHSGILLYSRCLHTSI